MLHFLFKNYAVSVDFMECKLGKQRKNVLISEAEYSRMGACRECGWLPGKRWIDVLSAFPETGEKIIGNQVRILNDPVTVIGERRSNCPLRNSEKAGRRVWAISQETCSVLVGQRFQVKAVVIIWDIGDSMPRGFIVRKSCFLQLFYFFTGAYLKTVNTPKQRAFSACCAPFFCNTQSIPAKKWLHQEKNPSLLVIFPVFR